VCKLQGYEKLVGGYGRTIKGLPIAIVSLVCVPLNIIQSLNMARPHPSRDRGPWSPWSEPCRGVGATVWRSMRSALLGSDAIGSR
jgi:hypothetical protein